MKQYEEWKCDVETTFHIQNEEKLQTNKLNDSLEECLFPFVFDYLSTIISSNSIGIQLRKSWLNRYKEGSFQERHSHAGKSDIISFIYVHKTTENHSALRFHSPFDIMIENVKGYSPVEFSHERHDFIWRL